MFCYYREDFEIATDNTNRKTEPRVVKINGVIKNSFFTRMCVAAE